MVFYWVGMNNFTAYCPGFNRTISSTSHVRALCREFRLKEAISIMLTTHNPPRDSQTYIQLLQTCTAKKNLSE
ncbi:hypothetical protein SUGI_0649030, partial [Cryptomeria japonica]